MFLERVRRSLAQRSLSWCTGDEFLYGETVDISLFRFPWFSPIWYYDGREKMPKSKMKKGYVLGIADHVGDAFTYQILPELRLTRPRKRKVHLTRSVIRLRLGL